MQQQMQIQMQHQAVASSCMGLDSCRQALLAFHQHLEQQQHP